MRSATSSSVGAASGVGACSGVIATTVPPDGCGAGSLRGAVECTTTVAAGVGVAAGIAVAVEGAGAGAAIGAAPVAEGALVSPDDVGGVDSDNHAGGAHARGGSVVSAMTGSCKDPSTVVVDGCGTARVGVVGAAGRSAPELTTIVDERVAVAAAAGAATGAAAAAMGAADSAAAVAGASVDFGFALRSSHSPQYRHLTAAS
jgi:hypothetical protein